ncbi:hypothetical protein F5B20DRAFT_82923 [Whalleya microplaca]|nr:hypothetical protein F5B20DRAFT_82923 [Whalleya microplaca]
MACFGWGRVGVLLAGCIERKELLRNWAMLTAVVVTSTIHTQDLPDVAGDKAGGRKTIPLIYGEKLARWSVAILAPLWSVVCLIF